MLVEKRRWQLDRRTRDQDDELEVPKIEIYLFIYLPTPGNTNIFHHLLASTSKQQIQDP